LDQRNLTLNEGKP